MTKQEKREMKKMVTSLIRGKQFYRSRLFCFKERHCENCLSVVRSDADGAELMD